VWLVRTIEGLLVHSGPCHPLRSKRGGPGDEATRLESQVHQEAGLETGTPTVYFRQGLKGKVQPKWASVVGNRLDLRIFI